ncbi:MAG: hypothetical protein ACYCO0_00830 [Candidatus Micrarchaeaceae archaeon]
MDIFDVISNSAKAVKDHPKYLVPAFFIMLLGFVLGGILGISLLTSMPSHISTGQSIYTKLLSMGIYMGPLITLLFIIICLSSIFVNGMFIDLCYKWKSKKVSLAGAFAVAKTRYKELLIYAVVAFAINAALAAILLLPVVFIGYNNVIYPYLNGIQIKSSGFIVFLAALLILGALYIIAEIILSILLWLGPPMVVIDRMAAIPALKASIAAGKKDGVRIFLTMLALGIITAGFVVVTSIIQIIPVLGAVLALILDIAFATFTAIIAPMYYITFFKSKK